MLAVSFTNALLSLTVSLLIIALWKLIPILIAPYSSTLRDLPGPPSSSWVFGNLKQIFNPEDSVLHEAWVEKYGPTIKYKGWLGSNWLYTVDMRALHYVLSHAYIYHKPAQVLFNLGQLLGKGLLVMEGEQHRQQRRIMNPAFGPAQIRELTDIFVDKAIQLRELWKLEIAKDKEPVHVNVLNGLSKMTLDVIGLAGFNYDFDALNVDGKPNELNSALDTMLRKPTGFSVLNTLQAHFPPLRMIRDKRGRRIHAARKVMARIGMQLIAEKKAEVMKAIATGEKGDNMLHSRDLLTLLIKANMSSDIPENQRLSDEDVLAQVPTFLVAGHETTSNATGWCLYALTQAPEVQRKLREELLSVPTETPTMDELNELPYLEGVVRETMRVHAPVPSALRVAMQDDVIPLDTPYTDIYGQVHDNIKIKKGDSIYIPILALNRSKELWGDDALEFKPERWEAIPEKIKSIPGVWGHLMSFLGGPHACIGYRFSLVEMKALIFTLVRAFEFELAVSREEIIATGIAVQRPVVRSEPEKGYQMPLLIKPYESN